MCNFKHSQEMSTNFSENTKYEISCESSGVSHTAPYRGTDTVRPPAAFLHLL